MSDLDAINDSLAAHFVALHDARVPLRYPTYAIEHPLDGAAIAQLKRALAARLQQERILEQHHWLCWTIIAAEVGYTFDGEEYWDTFGDEIPTWQRYGGDRRQIRRWFKKFATQFGDMSPRVGGLHTSRLSHGRSPMEYCRKTYSRISPVSYSN